MSKLNILCQEYAGDPAWNNFANCFEDESIGSYVPDLDLDLDMQKILIFKLGNREILPVWIDKKIPALDNMSVNEVLQDHRNGKTIIRTFIMRMPQICETRFVARCS